MKICRLLFLLLPGLIVSEGYCQDSVRYRDMVFSDVRVIKDIVYSEFTSKEIKTKRHRMDIYMPEGDTVSHRPLMIWIHGGGFKFGNKRSRGIPIWCKAFAKRGYVCAAVNYRLSKKNTLSDFTELVRACYNAIDDVREAVSYLKTQHATYGIDTNYIVLAGNSAGGMVALQAVYAPRDELAALAKLENSHADSAIHSSSRIHAVVNLWGALYDTAWLRNARVPVVSIHGRKDKIVPYDHKGTPLYGSYVIHQKAGSLGIPNQLLTFDQHAHELQKNFNPLWVGRATKKRWLQAGEFVAAFLYPLLPASSYQQ